MDLNDINIGNRALKAYRITSNSEDEYQNALAKCLPALNTWWLLPNWVWIVILVISITIASLSPQWWNMIGIVLAVYSSGQLATRNGQLEGFIQGMEDGYILGREDGAYRALDIPIEDQTEWMTKLRKDELEIQTGII